VPWHAALVVSGCYLMTSSRIVVPPSVSRIVSREIAISLAF
jgi:hypothetical protein